MEGVGARLGRSSARYAPTTVFNGRVRKWKKRWVHVSPSATAGAANPAHSTAHNGVANGNNGSRLLLYKWTPISQTGNDNDNDNGNGDARKISGEDDTADASEEPPRRKLRYVPIIILDEQNDEAAQNIDNETKLSEADPSKGGPTTLSERYDGKPDINDVPMEDNQGPRDDARIARQDLNESTLDLSLGLKARAGEHDSNLKSVQTRDG